MSLIKLLCIVVITVASALGCKNSPSDTKTVSSMPVFPVAGKSAILATIPDDEKTRSLLSSSDPEGRSTVSNLQGVVFAGNGGGVAYAVGKGEKSYVVYKGKAGSLYNAIGTVVLSPDGSRIAYGAVVDEKWLMVVDGEVGKLFSEVRDPLFSPDGRHLLYQAMNNDVSYLVVDTTVNRGAKSHYRRPQFSGDSASLIYIDNIDETDFGRLVVCDIKFNKERIIDPRVTSFGFNADKSVVAAISRSKTKRERIIQFNFANIDAVMKGAEYDKVLSAVFAPSGSDLLYFGERQGKIYGVFNGQEEVLPEGLMPGFTVINQAGGTVGVLMSANNTVHLYQMFRNRGRVGNAYDEAEGLVYSSNGAMSAFAARKGKSWMVVANGKEGQKFDRVVTPKFSPDGNKIVYRARKDGKRFVVVADENGRTTRQHPAYEQVFQPVFSADGKSVAYGVKEGNKLIWKVEKL